MESRTKLKKQMKKANRPKTGDVRYVLLTPRQQRLILLRHTDNSARDFRMYLQNNDAIWAEVKYKQNFLLVKYEYSKSYHADMDLWIQTDYRSADTVDELKMLAAIDPAFGNDIQDVWTYDDELIKASMPFTPCAASYHDYKFTEVFEKKQLDKVTNED